MTDLRYPIGEFAFPEKFDRDDRARAIHRIDRLPGALRIAVRGLDDRQLDTPYRDGGWTVRQVVHHLPDSHLNAYVRSKLALTEDHPTIRPYLEARWAELPDSGGPIGGSLDLLEHLHRRWVRLLRAVPDSSFSRTFLHPEGNRVVSMDRLVATYAWHGEHHAAHITSLRTRSRW